MVSNTCSSSPGELEMTRSTSSVAACRSKASLSSRSACASRHSRSVTTSCAIAAVPCPIRLVAEGQKFTRRSATAQWHAPRVEEGAGADEDGVEFLAPNNFESGVDFAGSIRVEHLYLQS